MINHTRVDAFDFLLCGQLTARWRNSNRKSAFWWGNLDTNAKTTVLY